MVVNNPATNDVRVVKQAKELVRNGGKCTILGVYKPGFPQREIVDGIQVLRVSISYNFQAILLAFFPKMAAILFRVGNERSFKKDDYVDSSAKGFPETNRSRDLSAKKILVKLLSLTSRLFVKTIFRFPFLQPVTVRLRQGAYLNAFYPVVQASKAAIIQSHELSPLESCVLASNGRKVVYDSHELERYRNSRLSRRSMRVLVNYEERYMPYVNEVFAVSPGCANQLKSDYSLDHVHVVRNCPLLSMQKEAAITLRQKLNLPQKTPLIVYTGSVTFNRGLEQALRALQGLVSFHLACVGPASLDILNSLKDLSFQLGVEARFHYVERVDPEELISFISDADLSIIPIQNACLSYYYCLPNKLFEAIHARLPIVASNLPDMQTVVTENKLGEVFDLGDDKSLSDAILEAYLNRDIEEKAQDGLLQRYSFEREFSSVLKVYEVMGAGCEL